MNRKFVVLCTTLVLGLTSLSCFAISPGAGQAQIQNNTQQMQQNKQQMQQNRQRIQQMQQKRQMMQQNRAQHPQQMQQ